MKAKFVYEAIGNIFKPKSEEDIMSSIGDLSPVRLLDTSAQLGFLPGVKKAIEMGADINNFALRFASEYGHYDVVKLLLDNGADVNAQNDYALRWASHKGHYDIVELLLKHGANVHADHDSALQYASQKGHRDVVELLKKYM